MIFGMGGKLAPLPYLGQRNVPEVPTSPRRPRWRELPAAQERAEDVHCQNTAEATHLKKKNKTKTISSLS